MLLELGGEAKNNAVGSRQSTPHPPAKHLCFRYTLHLCFYRRVMQRIALVTFSGVGNYRRDRNG